MKRLRRLKNKEVYKVYIQKVSKVLFIILNGFMLVNYAIALGINPRIIPFVLFMHLAVLALWLFCVGCLILLVSFSSYIREFIQYEMEGEKVTKVEVTEESSSNLIPRIVRKSTLKEDTISKEEPKDVSSVTVVYSNGEFGKSSAYDDELMQKLLEFNKQEDSK